MVILKKIVKLFKIYYYYSFKKEFIQNMSEIQKNHTSIHHYYIFDAEYKMLHFINNFESKFL